MKIAVISDIHANLIALQEVLKDIEEHACDKILCLGDLVLGGPQPLETIKFIMKQDWITIQGNTDLMITDFTDEFCQKVTEAYPAMGHSMRIDSEILPQECKDFMKNKPAQQVLEIEGIKILMVHGSPRKNNENIYPALDIKDVEEMIKGTDADLILCGHTHTPCGYQTNTKQTVLNVGSVGRSMSHSGEACYAIINIQDGEITAAHRLIPYNQEKAADLMRKRGFVGANDIAELILHAGSRHA